MDTYDLLFSLIGIFTTVAAVLDWDWLMNHRKAKFIVRILGRNGARIFYGAAGLYLLWAGIRGGF